MTLRYDFQSWTPALKKARALKRAGCQVKLVARGRAKCLRTKGPWAQPRVGQVFEVRGSDVVDVSGSTPKQIRLVRESFARRWVGGLAPMIPAYAKKGHKTSQQTIVAKPVARRMSFVVTCKE